jgi:hypothetical protein
MPGAFVRNKARLAHHRVQPNELQVLMQVSQLGHAVSATDFLFILNSIRQAMAPENGSDMFTR